ncbi:MULTISPECIES: ATP-binding protein [unclassified Streptomyces]|uniref:ATP-binding protein n=1 Tax=unclassified Streptomyces TaxID=2593676 RepID=UPI001F04B846|nr:MULTISPECIES: ATP-binding protein [unclassified Streptomyces]MCH0565194.1 ATP-binding protein [Streptomyces sp. MUM 2J]MCH0568277.1 ATP-binding protein [Streptomyces sp. MUM 136J]
MTTGTARGWEPSVFDIVDETDLIRVRKVLRCEAEAVGLNLVDATKLITAGSELARNILYYATGGRGRISVEQVYGQGRRGVRATFADDGPGIADIGAALTDGFSTRGSLGLGLPGARRLVDDMTITSAAASGTTVVIVKWQR